MRLIDADALRTKALWMEMPDNQGVNFDVRAVSVSSIDLSPTIDAVPVVHGRWDVTKEYNDVIEMDVVKYTCSACGEYRLSATGLSQATNYCPNCGAKMDLKEG